MKEVFLPLGLCYPDRAWELPLKVFQLFNCGFCWFIFYIYDREICLIQAAVTRPGLFFVLWNQVYPNSPHVWLLKVRFQSLNPFPKMGITTFPDGFYSVSNVFNWELFQPKFILSDFSQFLLLLLFRQERERREREEVLSNLDIKIFSYTFFK